MLWTGLIGRDERKVDVVLLGGRECDFGFLGFFLDALNRVGLLREIDAGVGFELAEEGVHDGIIPVVTAEVRVAIRGLHFEHAVTDFQHGDVEGSAAEIVHRDFFVALFVQSVGERGCGGFVNDAKNFEARDFAGVFGGVALRIVEVRGDSDDGLRDGFAEFGFCIRLEFCENHRADFWRGVALLLTVDGHLDVSVAVGGFDHCVGYAVEFILHFIELASHEAFDRENGVLWVGDGLSFCSLADEAFAIFGEGDDGGCGTRAFAVLEDDGFAAFHDGHAGVGGAEIDSEDFSHIVSLILGSVLALVVPYVFSRDVKNTRGNSYAVFTGRLTGVCWVPEVSVWRIK